jgi:CheY-like chemotaxis protein
MAKIRSLLLIDDDQDDQLIFEDALMTIDRSVTLSTSIDGIEALLKLEMDYPDLPDMLILDMNMPKMNGKQLLATLKASEKYKHLPVIIYSTSSNPDDGEETKIPGAVDFIVKPNNFTALCNLIREIMNKDW